jgi:hypothetical protein
MKIRCILLFLLTVLSSLHAQQRVAIVDIKTPLPGACDSTKVYALYNKYEGQEQAIPPISLKEIEARLNKEVKYIKDHPDYKRTVGIECIINCKGELIRCTAYRRKYAPELSEQLITVFSSLKKWTPAKLNGVVTDCAEDFRIEIKNGIITLSTGNDY